jgi:hypothetical protein
MLALILMKIHVLPLSTDPASCRFCLKRWQRANNARTTPKINARSLHAGATYPNRFAGNAGVIAGITVVKERLSALLLVGNYG